MELDRCMKERRSIRKYKDKAVSKEDVMKILDAATAAPNAGNLQNWRFVVVDEETKKVDISKACSNQNWISTASTIIVVCSDIRDLKRHFGEDDEEYSSQNCSAAVQNMLLTSHELGLGTCWIGGFDKEKITGILKIPDKEYLKIEAVISLGYSDEDGEVPEKYDMRRIVYFNEWSTIR